MFDVVLEEPLLALNVNVCRAYLYALLGSCIISNFDFSSLADIEGFLASRGNRLQSPIFLDSLEVHEVLRYVETEG